MSRAERRHHRERLLKARSGYWGAMYPGRFQYTNDAKRLSKIARTPQPCSCQGCGNQRKWEGPTLQELRCVFDDEA